MAAMRLLAVLPGLPHAPFTGAHTRPLSMLRAAARHHNVVAVGLAPAGSDLDPLRALCDDVVWSAAEAAQPRSRPLLSRGRKLLSPVPLIGRGRSVVLAGLVGEAVRRYAPDALYVETMYGIHYRFSSLPTIVDLPDVVSGLCEAAAQARPVRYAGARLQAMSSRRHERSLLPNAVPVTINDDDRARLARLGVEAFTVPLAVSLPSEDALRAGDVARDESSLANDGAVLRLLFVGSYLHAPNREAARFLVGLLAPALRARGLRFHLTLAGRSAPPWLLAARADDVRVASDVADLSPLYRAADVVVVPLAHGGGTKNKTLEAMAWGRAVLGSAQAFTGIDDDHHDLGMRAPRTVEAFAGAIGALSVDSARRARLAGAARDYVARFHCQALVDRRVRCLCDAVAAGGGVAQANALWAESAESHAHRETPSARRRG
jgi:hypothetical protein